MEGQGNPFEEIQRLAKSVLARQLKDVLDQPGIPTEEKIKHVRGLVEFAIRNVPQSPPDKKMAGLAKSVLAYQITDILSEQDGSDEEKAEEVRSWVKRFIVNP